MNDRHLERQLDSRKVTNALFWLIVAAAVQTGIGVYLLAREFGMFQ